MSLPTSGGSVPSPSLLQANYERLQCLGQKRIKLSSHDYKLEVIQQPVEGRAAGREKRNSRWPIDPPPLIRFSIKDGDETRSYLNNPFFFVTAQLLSGNKPPAKDGANEELLTGSLVSSLHKVKLQDNQEHALFVFGDLNAKYAGHHKIKFTLFEMRAYPGGMFAAQLAHTYSKEFIVTPSKQQNSIKESTPLTRAVCESGCRLRVRKETSKRKSQTQDWAADIPMAVNGMQNHHNMGHASMPPPAWPPQNGRGQSIDLGSRLQVVVEPQRGQELGIRTYMDHPGQQGVPAAMPHHVNGTNNLPRNNQSGMLPPLPVSNIVHSTHPSNGYGQLPFIAGMDNSISMAPSMTPSFANSGHPLQSAGLGSQTAPYTAQMPTNGSTAFSPANNHSNGSGLGPQPPYAAQMQTNESTPVSTTNNHSNGYQSRTQFGYSEVSQYHATNADSVYPQMATDPVWPHPSTQHDHTHLSGYNGGQFLLNEPVATDHHSMQFSQGTQPWLMQ